MGTSAAKERPNSVGGVWISWERQRRTVELAKKVGIPLVCLTHRGPRWRRYLVLIPATIAELLKRRPARLFVQNPSILLAVVAAFMRRFLGYRLVVDRHTNFMLNRPNSVTKRIFTWLSDWTLRQADVTIVTNRYLADLVTGRGGRAFVLQDPLPELSGGAQEGPPGRHGFLVCTYAPDEPFAEVVAAMASLPPGCRLYVSGRLPTGGFAPDLQAMLSRTPGIVLTGYLPEDRYIALMATSAFVVVLTRSDHCLVCGAYEALALRRPLVLSNRSALRDYFGTEVPRYVDDSPESIASGLAAAFRGELPSIAQIDALRDRLSRDWNRRFEELKTLVGTPPDVQR